MGTSKKSVQAGDDEGTPRAVESSATRWARGADRAELEERSELLEMVLEATNDGIWDWNLVTGRIVYSARWKAMLGYADHELANEPDTWKRVMHPEDYPRVRAMFMEHIAGTAPYSHLSRFLHKDGSVRWMMVRAKSIRDAQDRVTRMVGNHTDVTEIKAAQEGLALQEKLLTVTGRIAGVGGWELDVATGRTRWTDEIYRIYDLPDHTETDVDIGLQCYPEPGRSQLQLALTRAVKDGTAYDLELPFVTTAGRHRWVRVQCYPETEDGAVRRIYGTIHDVTQERQTQIELTQAMEGARAAAEAKAKFFKSISHEMRTPLQGILGMAEVLPERATAEDIRACASTIQRSGEALLTVINDVLAFTDADAGRVRPARAPVDMREVVDTVVDLVSAGANAKQLDVLSVVEGAVPQRFVGDSSRMRQVLLSLLSNAVKFTDTGCVVVEVSVTPYRCVRVCVSDTGVGMDDSQAARVFEPMVGPAPSGGMSGLSLATSARVITALNGRMGVRPRSAADGAGCVFWFEVPLGDSTEPFEGVGDLSAEGGRALVVHPHPQVRGALGQLLGEAGLDTVGAATAQEAVEVLGAGGALRPVSLVVADGALLNELQQALREATRPARRPGVMVMTFPSDAPGHLDASVPLQGLPFDVRVQKPVRQGEFLRTVRVALAAARVGAVPTGESAPAATPAAARPLRVLVAEDNATNQRVLRLQLASLGVEAEFVGDGAAAVRGVHAAEWDLLLMDVMMPGLGGVEATAEIRRAGRTVEQPMIVGVSAAATAEERARGLDAGMDDYLAKPVAREDLQRVMAVARARKNSLTSVRAEEFARATDAGRPAVAQSVFEDPEPTEEDTQKSKARRKASASDEADTRKATAEAANEHTSASKRKKGAAAKGQKNEEPAGGIESVLPHEPRWPERIGGQWPGGDAEREPWWSPVADLLDVPGLTTRLGGDEHFVRSVLRTYCNDAPVQMNALAQACRGGGWREIRAAAHAVKGSALNMGLGGVARLAYEVEKAARSEDAAALTRGVPELQQAFEQAHARLRQLSPEELRS